MGIDTIDDIDLGILAQNKYWFWNHNCICIPTNFSKIPKRGNKWVMFGFVSPFMMVGNNNTVFAW